MATRIPSNARLPRGNPGAHCTATRAGWYGLVFGSRLYRGRTQDYGLRQEFITPCTPEQNGLAERFIRSFKEECAWQHNFESLEAARQSIVGWIAWYNGKRPHQALKYKTPDEVAEDFKRAAVVAA